MIPNPNHYPSVTARRIAITGFRGIYSDWSQNMLIEFSLNPQVIFEMTYPYGKLIKMIKSENRTKPWLHFKELSRLSVFVLEIVKNNELRKKF